MRIWLLLCCSVLTACAGSSQRTDDLSRHLGFTPVTLIGNGFNHRAYTFRFERPEDLLHVYIEHDGLPWTLNGTLPSPDPTASRPVMLELMGLDEVPSLYLGRPCYLGEAQTPPCNPLLWTHERYSESVVASMVAALQGVLKQRSIKRVSLFGHSGGGTLALLMARHLTQTTQVVTIAGNLSIGHWAQLHSYAPLEGSIDPVELSGMSERVIEWHYVGALDGNTPVSLAREYLARHPHARLVVLPSTDHMCCWRAQWETILQELRSVGR